MEKEVATSSDFSSLLFSLFISFFGVCEVPCADTHVIFSLDERNLTLEAKRVRGEKTSHVESQRHAPNNSKVRRRVKKEEEKDQKHFGCRPAGKFFWIDTNSQSLCSPTFQFQMAVSSYIRNSNYNNLKLKEENSCGRIFFYVSGLENDGGGGILFNRLKGNKNLLSRYSNFSCCLFWLNLATSHRPNRLE